MLVPLILFGLVSVFYWQVTQQQGRGDLRSYALVQFGSMLAILLLIVLFPPRYTRTTDLVVSFLIYGLVKVFEAADRPIFAGGHIVSGHTLKHFAAALSAFWILRMLQLRHSVTSAKRT